jgi:hypothetical protein
VCQVANYLFPQVRYPALIGTSLCCNMHKLTRRTCWSHTCGQWMYLLPTCLSCSHVPLACTWSACLQGRVVSGHVTALQQVKDQALTRGALKAQ